MSVDKAYTIFAADLAGTLIDGGVDMAVDPGVSLMVTGADGDVRKSFSAVASVDSLVNFTTTQVANLLGVIGEGELKITSGAVATFFYQQLDEGARRKGITSHLKKVVNQGIAVPRIISASQGSAPATMSVDTVATWDGTNDPVVITDSQSLVGSPTVDEQFTVGPVKINGSFVGGVQSIDIDFGKILFVLSADGDGFPTFVSVNSISPTIRIVTTDVSFAATLGNFGVVQGATDSVVFLRKKLQGNINTPDVTAEHISFTMDEGQIVPGRSSVNHEGNATKEFLLQPTYDGTNEPFVIATNSAIA